MLKVNYVLEAETFIEYASHNSLSGNERALWYALFHLMNREAKGAGWPERFISVPNKVLLALVPFSEDVLPDVRNRLTQRGLIEYLAGERNKRPPRYAMRYFYPQIVDNSCGKPVDNLPDGENDLVCADVAPEKPGKTPGKNTRKTPGKNTGNIPGKNTDIELNYRETKREPYETFAEEEASGAGDNEGRARMELLMAPEEQAQFWLLRKTLYTPEVRTMYSQDMDTARRLVETDLYPVDLVTAAVQKTISRHERNPLDRPAAYTVKLLEDWTARGIHSAEDLENHIRGWYEVAQA